MSKTLSCPNYIDVVMVQVGVGKKTVIDWFMFVRDVCSADLLAQPMVIGGPGQTVAIDESVVARAKPGNGRGRPVPPQWVFGGVELGTGRFFMELFPCCNANTLVPVIRRHIRPGTRIWSDEWGAYARLNQVGYIHQTVNHSIQYVDPVTGVHTNNIEACWSACKASFRRRWGVARHHLPAYLDEYLWRAKHPRPDTFPDIVDTIRRQ